MAFIKGQSGNPRGKPKGAKDKRTILRALLEPHSKALVDTAVKLALAGDTTALRICIDRIIPSVRPGDVPIALPLLTGGTPIEQSRQVIAALASGDVTPDQASAVMQLVTSHARILEICELERRLKALEDRLAPTEGVRHG